MAVPEEKQGYLGNLNNKTLPELRELLERQENILKKRKFLLTLHDKGEKVKRFAEKLTRMIAEREMNRDAAMDFVNVDKLEVKQRNLSTFDQLRDKTVFNTDKEESDLSRKEQPEIKKEKAVTKGDNSVADVGDLLSDSLKRVTLSESKHPSNGQSGETYVNSYERVIKKAEERPKKREVFKPNRSLKISKLEEMPDEYKFKSRNQHSVNESELLTHDKRDPTSCDIVTSSDASHNQIGTSEIEVKMQSDDSGGEHVPHQSLRKPSAGVREESAVCIPDYKFEKTKLISVEESVQLVQEQRVRQEELQTRQAASRLAARFNVKMEPYVPEMRDMNYRTQDPVSDSDDEPELLGYPDNED